MKFPRGKGQGALEYLQTYGWAILVVLIVGVVLWQLGVFGPHSGVNTSSGFIRLKVFDPSIIYHAGATDNALNFTVVNSAAIRVKLLRTQNITGDCARVAMNGYFMQAGHTQTSCDLIGGLWLVGACWMQKALTLDGGETAFPTTTADCTNLDAGEAFVINFVFVYQERIGKDYVTHYDTGTMRGIAE